MEATELVARALWEGQEPLVLAGPRLREDGARLEALLTEEGWAQGAVVFASSGSTGMPKWILHRRESLLASARMVNEYFEVGQDDHWFLALPDWHVGGIGVAARAYLAGCGFGVLEGRWDVQDFLAQLSSGGATLVSLVPAQVHDLVVAGVRAPESLRVAVVGGGSLLQQTGEAARDLGWPVLQSYGMTEAASQIATATSSSLEERFCPDRLKVLPGWDVGVNDAGLLKIRGKALFGGYVEENDGGVCLREGTDDGWFVTSDLVSLSNDLLTFAGRRDRTVKVLGELVEVDRLERDLTALAGTGQALRIMVMEDGRLGSRLVPVVEGSGREWGVRVEEYNRTLPGYARLDPPVMLGQFPRTELGKVDLGALSELLQAMVLSGDAPC